MTYREKYSNCKTWFGRVRVMHLYHTVKTSLSKSHTVADTANYFNVSTGLVSENINIGNHMKHVKKLGSRKKALDYLRSNDGN